MQETLQPVVHSNITIAIACMSLQCFCAGGIVAPGGAANAKHHVLLAGADPCQHAKSMPPPPALTLMRLAPSAKRSVFHVSSLWLEAGVTLQMMATLAPLPVSDGCTEFARQQKKHISVRCYVTKRGHTPAHCIQMMSS
jgi:hypothetical protein